MRRESHVRICESVGVKFPRATRLTFSFATEPERPQALGRFLWWVDQVCQQLGPARRRAGHGPGALVSTPYPGRPSIAGFAAGTPL